MKTARNRLGIDKKEWVTYLILVIIFLFVWAFHSYGGIKDVAKYPVKLTYKVISNEYVQWYGSTALLMTAAYFNGVDNALLFTPKYTTYGTDWDSWHAWKNGTWLFVGGAIFLKGYAVGKGNYTISEFFWHFLKCEAPLMWEVWQNVAYDYTKYGRIFDYRPEYNEHRIVFPKFSGDNYAPAWMNKPWVWGTMDAGLITTGLYHLVRR